MTESNDLTRIRNTPEDVYVGRIRQNTGRGRYLAVAALLVVTAFWLLVSCAALTSPAAAQAPIVTPYPGPIATATAAAQQVNNAEAQRAEGQRLIQQGQEQQAIADAQIRAAQQAAIEARNALQAQQYQAALDAVSRSETSVSTAQAQINALRASGEDVRGIIDAQAARIISMTMEIQQLRADKQTTLNAYNAAFANQEQMTRNDTLLRIIGLFIMFLFLLIALAFGANKLRMRAMRSDDEGAAGEIEIVDQE